jgi:AP endonuclease 2
LHDTIVDEQGRELKLSDALQSPSATLVDSREPPRICAKNWDEYSAKQTLLSTFFTPRTALASTSSESQTPPLSLATPPTSTELLHSSGPSLPQPPAESGLAVEEAGASSLTQSSQKRKRPIDDCGQVKKAKVDKPKNGQSKLSSFFQKPKPTQGKGKDSPIEVHEDEKPAADPQYDRDLEMAIVLSQAEPSSSPSTSKAPRVGNKEAWSNLLAPLQVPNCTVHGEPSKLYTVNKQGPSKGKTFFLCSR